MSAVLAGTARSSPLVQLPREIRDLIYGYLLGPDVIPVECAVTKAPRSRVAVGGEIGFCEALYQRYKLTYPLEHRTTWTMPVNDLAVPADDFQLDSSTVHMTYQLKSSDRDYGRQPLELQLLEVCQQLHTEVSEMFYRRKTFSFTSDFAIPAVAAFLGDRSAQALESIRHIEVCLHEALAGSPRSGDFPKHDTASTLRNTYGFFPKLCALLASRWIKLCRLSLIIQSRLYNWRDEPERPLPTMRQLAENDHGDLDAIWLGPEKGLPASWVHPLLNIKELDMVSVYWVLTSSTIQRELDTVLLMRQSMLKGSRRTKRNDELEFRSVLGNFPQISVRCVAWYDPETNRLRWRDDEESCVDDTFALGIVSGNRAFRMCQFTLAAAEGQR